jgi:hypothetical protein
MRIRNERLTAGEVWCLGIAALVILGVWLIGLLTCFYWCLDGFWGA